MAYTAISSQVLSTAQSSVVFSSIPQTFRDLVLVITARGTTTSFTGAVMTFNGSSTGYSTVAMFGNGSQALSYSETSTVLSPDQIARSDAPAGTFTPIVFNIMDYSVTDKHKSVLSRNSSANIVAHAGAHRWANTAAITSITLGPINGNFEVGSTFSLYGVSA